MINLRFHFVLFIQFNIDLSQLLVHTVQIYNLSLNFLRTFLILGDLFLVVCDHSFQS